MCDWSVCLILVCVVTRHVDCQVASGVYVCDWSVWSPGVFIVRLHEECVCDWSVWSPGVLIVRLHEECVCDWSVCVILVCVGTRRVDCQVASGVYVCHWSVWSPGVFIVRLHWECMCVTGLCGHQAC